MNPFVLDNLRPALKDKRILLGISGSIAAFKACDIVRHLRAAGAEVRVVLTESASRFVTPVTLETLSGQPVRSSMWDTGGQGTHHIDSARWADLALVAPATANTIAKLAQGMADDLLTTELLAFRGPILIAPAMNPAMYEHPAVQANLALLQGRGALLAGPASGVTSCGEEGPGRMLEPEDILPLVARAIALTQRGLAPSAARALEASPSGKRVLITLGPTRSAIDPVRYVTNRSSGLMGAALAWASWLSGHSVAAVAGPTDAPLPPGTTVHRVQTSHEMLDHAGAEFDACDVFIASAAVLDWDVANPAASKLKKEQGAPEPRFERAPDVLATLCARRKPSQFVLGFAAETAGVVQSGIQKRLTKGCNALFANDVSLAGQGFESTRNGGWWISADAIYELPVRPKAELARVILELIEGKKPDSLRNLQPPTAKLPAGDPEPHPATARPDDARVS